MRINLIDSLLNFCGMPVNDISRRFVIRDIPYSQIDIFYKMDEMINEMGGHEYCMEFNVSYKYKSKYGFPKEYKSIPIKTTASTTKKIIILKPFLI